MLLPCCQRCLGLYVGAAVAAGSHLWLRPRLTGRFLELHGAFLLCMLPFGFHWLPQGPLLRTITGVLFGFGVVTFLWLPMKRSADFQSAVSPTSSRLTSRILEAVRSAGRPQIGNLRYSRLEICATGLAGRDQSEARPGASKRWRPALRAAAYFVALAATLVLLPRLAAQGGMWAAYALSALAFSGAIALGALVLADLGAGLRGTVPLVRRLTRARTRS